MNMAIPAGRAIRRIPLDRIDPGDRLRRVDEERAKQLATSWGQVGQLTPIELRPSGEDRFVLVAGAHRLRAAEIREEAEIDAIIFEGDPEDAVASRPVV
jgi:ParB family transcriptional regulator, chromosome partitioning protein